jgi:NAD(P)-dependent dehydrogenase (short-subunit alcohol dehydrogenase family)
VLEPFVYPDWPDDSARLSADIAAGLARLGRGFRQLAESSKKDLPMQKLLAGQRVVVIGGSSGLGAAVASMVQAQGAHVIAFSRSGIAPAGVEPFQIDISDRAMLADALDAVGPIDHLVHTAGARTPSKGLAEVDQHLLDQTFNTKLFSAIHTIRLALPYLTEEASITLTSGQVSRKYGTDTLVKGAVNAAIDAAGRHLAKELAPRRVNVISPGIVDTEMWGAAGSETRSATLERAASSLPVRRAGAPSDLAAAYLFAMTNKFVTGAVIDVDGGGLL